MPRPRIALRRPVPAEVSWEELRAELQVPGAFPPDVLAQAQDAAAAPRLPDLDRTDQPFLTIDPAGSLDLDQAMHLERSATGWTVSYAIADVGAFVPPGSALDAETHRRGETSYFPDLRVPLHPPVLSEGAASLLPGQVRPAVVWTLALDEQGALVSTQVQRARIRSQRRLEYGEVQRSIDDGSADEQLLLLRDIGLARQRLARERDAVACRRPSRR